MGSMFSVSLVLVFQWSVDLAAVDELTGPLS